MPDPNELLSLWHQALEEPYGIAIKTSDRSALSRALQSVRRAAEDERLDSLAVLFPYGPEELWLVRTDRPLPKPQARKERDLDKL
jgi:hypothetical protein